MIRKRLALAVLTLAATVATMFGAAPAQARTSFSVGLSVGGFSGYYHRGYRRHRYYRPVYYRPVRYVPVYEEECYRPVRRVTYARYRCGGCGERFSSSYWVSYHHRHADCW